MAATQGVYANHQGTGNVMLDLQQNITVADSAIEVFHGGTDEITITTRGMLESSSGRGIRVTTNQNNSTDDNTRITAMAAIETASEAISVSHRGRGSVIINAAALTATDSVSGRGIFVKAYNTTATGNIEITANGNIQAQLEGINIEQDGTGAVSVTTIGTVTSDAEEGINIQAGATTTGNVEIIANNDVTGAKDAIHVNHGGSGNVILTLGGSITGGGSNDAVDINTASGDATIILGTGASLGGNVDTSGVMGTTNIQLTGDSEADFHLDDDLGKFTDFNALEKTGSGTWRLTNRLGRTKTFDRIDVREGKLVSTALTELVGTSLNIAQGAIFEVEQQSTSLFNTAVTLSGTIELSGANTTLDVRGGITNNGGNVVIPVDFSSGDATLPEARLTTTSVVGTIPVNIKSVNAFQVPDNDEDGVITIENFLAVADANAFEAGNVLDNGNFNFSLAYDSVTSRWNLVARPSQSGGGDMRGGDMEGGGEIIAGSIKQALYESLPAALTQLASLQSYQQRLQGRRYGDSGGVWAKVSGFSAEFEPVATSLAAYEIKDSFAEFGVDVPLRAEHAGNFTVGASVSFGDATTEAAVLDSAGEIKTGSFKAAVSANWEYGGPYVDGHLQYAVFNNDVKTDAKLGSANATAYSGALEVGYGTDLGDLRVIPSARLLWASVDFEDFTDSAGTEIVLDDGVVVTGRAGVGVEYDWNGALFEGISSADILLRGRAGVLVPLDGDVNTRIGGMEFISEREEPVFDAGLGATYVWDGYALSADVSTRQGEEVEGYAGSVGFKYKF